MEGGKDEVRFCNTLNLQVQLAVFSPSFESIHVICELGQGFLIMASEENGGDRVFHKGNGIDPFYGSGWDPMISLNSSVVPQNEFGSAHFLEHQILGSSSHLVHFPSYPSSVEMLPKIPCFGSGSFSEMVSSFGHTAKSGSQSSFAQNNMVGIQRTSNSKDHCQNSGDGVLRASPNRSRKRKVSVGASPKNVEEQQHDTSEFPKKDDEKKHKSEKNIGEQTVEQAKDNSTDAEPPKENYIHIRAKRGQATNSHSLAERVRRERISERMRLLQEVVPGCNKITGKAVMLDEIINYVQSLQQQVEFLSMKLATVNPELTVDIEHSLSKDILHSRGSSSTALGNGLALSSSHAFTEYPHGTFTAAPHTLPFHPLPHSIWNNNDLQSILQMGFDSDNSVRSLGRNGMPKMEL